MRNDYALLALHGIARQLNKYLEWFRIDLGFEGSRLAVHVGRVNAVDHDCIGNLAVVFRRAHNLPDGATAGAPSGERNRAELHTRALFCLPQQFSKMAGIEERLRIDTRSRPQYRTDDNHIVARRGDLRYQPFPMKKEKHRCLRFRIEL